MFHYASDRKKAAGRALGTLVELVTFYTLRAWNLRDHIVIERSVPEFANPDITHNVEFSLHPIIARHSVTISPLLLPLTAAKIRKRLTQLEGRTCKSTQLLSKDRVLRNACALSDEDSTLFVANVDSIRQSRCHATVCELVDEPFAIFECKRVGVEEGVRKGPQTIEKAKQGAYVARSISALQKVRLRSGRFQGVIEKPDGTFHRGSYSALLKRIISSSDPCLLRGFILTIGVVSNHGNWFTSDNPNKELRVLAQSYDWLLFLTDAGLSNFIDKLLLNPSRELAPARKAFLASYSGTRGHNRFTKVRIDQDADQALQSYFAAHESEVESWYNVIAPRGSNLKRLRLDLGRLASKKWKEILDA
ncbi:MAG: hypothetical protein IIA64_01930 [Planctomycetes bacterium]|nr:hypothetical protein [Planctomycetota bacterium]